MIYENTFAVMKNQKGYSKHGGKQLNTLTLIRLADRKTYLTYIQPIMRNHQGWWEIVNDADSAHFIEIPDWTIVKKNIIDADCQPILHGSCSVEEMEQILEEKWREEDLEQRTQVDTRTGNSSFDRLFDITG